MMANLKKEGIATLYFIDGEPALMLQNCAADEFVAAIEQVLFQNGTVSSVGIEDYALHEYPIDGLAEVDDA